MAPMPPQEPLYIPPVVSASPHKAAAGQQIALGVNGFYANEEVVVRLLGQVSRPSEFEDRLDWWVQCECDGPNVPVGTYELSATGSTSMAVAHNTFVVVSG